MKANKLDVYDIENIEECISEIEKMYNFKFVDNELENVKTFEEFCDLIIEKINLKNVESCTSLIQITKRKHKSQSNISLKTNPTDF